jgi:hypothetical protein
MADRRNLLAGAAAVLALVAAVAGMRRYRRWHLSWGATDAEVAAPMPGDDLVDPAGFVATRAVTIEAPPEQVWPWIVQIGVGRAGFYSYDRLDNQGRSSATEILPEFQDVHEGDTAAPMVEDPDDRMVFRVAQVDPPRTLVWAKADSSWVWSLRELPGGRTRLVVRLKQHYGRRPSAAATVALLEAADFPMMRRQLLNIRERAATGWNGNVTHVSGRGPGP